MKNRGQLKLTQKIILLALLGLGLSACGPVYQTHYSYIPPRAWRGRQCVNRCLEGRSSCRSQCQERRQSCHNSAELAAMPEYLTYVQEQKNDGKAVTESIGDFADYSNCYDRCGCTATYHQCFINCGGEVIANTQCVAFCNEKTAQN